MSCSKIRIVKRRSFSRKRPIGFLEGTIAEKIYYELKPFFCMGAAGYVLQEMHLLWVGQLGAVLLLATGAMIVFERAKYRGYI